MKPLINLGRWKAELLPDEDHFWDYCAENLPALTDQLFFMVPGGKEECNGRQNVIS